MGRAVGGGMTWMVVSMVLTRVVTFLAQILLGKWLLPKDFALYATATSIAGFIMVCRDMATGHLLVQRGREQYNELAGPAFWIAMAYNVSVAGITAVIAVPLAQRVYHEPELAPMLWVMALALPLGAVGNVLFARMRLDMKFRAFSIEQAWSAIVRQLAMVVCARMGMGPMSFAWPILFYTLFDAVACWWLTRDSAWMRPPAFRLWGGMVRQALWLMINSLANFAMDFGPFLLMGPILVWSLNGFKTAAQSGEAAFKAASSAAYDVTGYYFFAYQITAQIGVMLAYSSVVVLVPALQRMKNDPERQRLASLRALRTLMMGGSIASIGLATVMGPLEHILWHGKYDASVPAVMIFGAFYPWRITFGLCTSVLMAQGAFRRLAVLSAFDCMGLMAAAAAAATFSPTVSGIAWWTGGWVMFSRVVGTWYVFYKMGTSARATSAALFPAWLVALAAFAIARFVDDRLGVNHAIMENAGLARWVLSKVGEAARELWMMRIADTAQILVAGSVCAGSFLVLARMFLADDLRDMLAVAPARFARPLSLAMRLRLDDGAGRA